MDKEDVSKYEDKRIKLFLQNNDILQGTIIQVKDNSIVFKDKYGAFVTLDYSYIKMIRPMEEMNNE